MKQRTHLYNILYISLLALLLIGPLWEKIGIPNSADGILHLHRSAAMSRAWADGIFWPRWFPDVYQGLGAPTFHYYSPLFYLLIAPLHMQNIPLDLATKLVITAMFILCGLAVSAWLRRLLNQTAGFAGAALYLSQPLFFREYYFQGDYPQLIALFLLPICLWAFTRLHDEGSWYDWLLAPLSLTLLVISHNLTAMLGATVLAFYWMALGLWYRSWTDWWRGVTGGLFAVGFSAFFWMPALGDVPLVNIQNLQQDFFRYDQYFLSWRELLAAPPIFDSRAANPPFPHQLGWAAWLALSGGFILLAVKSVQPLFQKRKGISFFDSASVYWSFIGLVLAFLYTLLTLPMSQPLWEILPGLSLLQYPSRLLGPAAIGVALVGGALVSAWGRRVEQWLAILLITTVGLCSAVFLFPGQPFLPINSYTGADTQAYERSSHVWGTTSGNEFLPKDAVLPENQLGNLLASSLIKQGIIWQWVTPHYVQVYGEVAPTVEALILPLYSFPGWKIRTSRAPRTVQQNESGLIVIKPPSGRRVFFFLNWIGTAWQHRGEQITIGTLFLWITFILIRFYRKWKQRSKSNSFPKEKSESCSGGMLRWHRNILLLLILLVGGRQWLSWTDLGWFQRYSPPHTVAGLAQPLDVNLGNKGEPSVNLLGWELLSDKTVRPSESISIRLYWQGTESIDQALHSFVHLYTPELKRSWVIEQNQNPGRIPTSSWLPALYYVDDLQLDLPPDLPPLTFTLAAGLVDEEGRRLDVPDSSDGLIYLDEIQIQPPTPGRRQPLQPSVKASAQFGDNIALQGYDLLPAPGGPILRLYWEALAQPPTDLVTFIHLFKDTGEEIAQFDQMPLEGLLPTSQWPTNSLLIDKRQLWLPESLVSGDYTFFIGLYDSVSGQRWPVSPTDLSQNQFKEDALMIPLYVP